ncbi:hypothetical protein LX32DRAFT_292222 [Colletotrichum zoysiae]|uniref:Uncharacterized protein n=1 Tax=Colletotrichum zoysiae TaxID=1216348 RepID=A0AAD9LUE8_9PEZI|nr:hypothetical protein LX32DRAFT_292222 [Colletotrichum zoysiae]
MQRYHPSMSTCREARRKTKPIRVPRFCFIRTTVHPCLSHPIAHQPCCTSSTQGMGTGSAVSISRDDSVGKDEDDSFDPVPHGRAVCTLTCSPGIPASVTPIPIHTPPRMPLSSTHTHRERERERERERHTHAHTHTPPPPQPVFWPLTPGLSHSLFSHLFPCCALQGHDGRCKAPFPGLCPAPSGPLSAFRSNAQDAALVIGLTQMTSTVHCRGPLLP